jgi:hypothetical protein
VQPGGAQRRSVQWCLVAVSVASSPLLDSPQANTLFSSFFFVRCFTVIKQGAWLGVFLLLCFSFVHHALYSAACEAVMSCEKGFINHN